MANLVAADEVILEDIIRLLDFNAPVHGPKVEAITLPLLKPNERSLDCSNCSDGTNKPKRTSKREREKTRQRRYRQRIKTSRDDLRRQVDDLSKELHQLNKKASNRTQLASSNVVIATSHWASAADRERKRRVQAEAEHKRLRSAVNHQVALIERLRLIAGKQLHDDVFMCQARGTASMPRCLWMTEVLYMTYLKQLEECYARVDKVMSTCGVVYLPETTFNSTHRREIDGKVAYFQHVNKMTLPFNFKQTCKALLTALHEKSEPGMGRFTRALEGDALVKYRVLRSENSATLAQRFISRVYMEENRCVLVWKMTSKGEGSLNGLQSEETAWMCVRPSASGVVIEVCAQQVPIRKGTAHTLESVTEQLYDILLKSIETDKMDMAKRLEGLLLDDVLTGIEC